MENLRMRSVLAGLGLALAIFWVSPNFSSLAEKWFQTKKLNYGLDIQGGLHLVMGVDVAGVVSESVSRLTTSLKSELEKEGIAGATVKAVQAELGEIEISLPSPDLKEKVTKVLEDRYGTMLQVLASTENSISARYFDAYLMDYKSKVIHQAIETIRNRIDEFGVAEPSISQQGADRILVQLPGVADAERAKALINTAARLDFMPVVDDKTPQELLTLVTEAEKAGNYDIKTLKYS
jgi:preprotein translocase subunit SecD